MSDFFGMIICPIIFVRLFVRLLACENSRFSSLFSAEDVSREGSSSRNVPRVEERGESDVLAGYPIFCPIFLPDYLSIIFARVFV